MALDTDPGIGVGYPVPYTPPVVGDIPQGEICVSFERSLDILNIDYKPGAYGFLGPDACDHNWAKYQREGWVDKMSMAADELKRDLGAPLCPIPVYDELHPFSERIRVRQSPVAYLGRHTFSDWTEETLLAESGGKYIELCDQDISPGGINDIEFSYPDAVLECYVGLQTLQNPCVWRIEGTCGAGADDGYKISWPIHQLVDPLIDSTEAGVAANFMTEIKWRLATIDADLAVDLVSDCNCTCCSDIPSTLTATLQDEIEGIICINNCDPLQSCPCSNSYIRINYGTTFSYGSDIAPSLEEAVVLLALVKAHKTPVKPCGCDNSWIEHMLEIDPTSANAFAQQLSYGPTNAGMRVMRTVDKFLKRPHYNQPVMTGGLFTGKRLKKRRRRSSYLRG